MYLTEFENIRGESAPLFPCGDFELPCIEVSSAELLCKNPLVSVVMTTYNHSAYIRQAIEGVVNQVADFEYEVIIGEDVSSDNTRQICLEYQKKYPEKIRVLWSHENLYNQDGNERRVITKCRGEYFAFCEGDDYWTDKHKLQKQITVLQDHLTVGLCFSDVMVRYENSGKEISDGERFSTYKKGVMTGDELFDRYLLGNQNGFEWNISGVLVRTPTTVFRKSVYEAALKKYELLSHKLYLTDVKKVLAVASLSDVYYCDDVMAVYRVSDVGVCSGSSNLKVWRDAWLLRLYFADVMGRVNDVKSLERVCCLKRLSRLFVLDKEAVRDELRQMAVVTRFSEVMSRFPMRIAVRMLLTPIIPYKVSFAFYRCTLKYLKSRGAFV